MGKQFEFIEPHWGKIFGLWLVNLPPLTYTLQKYGLAKGVLTIGFQE